MRRILALILCAALLLCGCSGVKNAAGFSRVVKFSDMVYVRPDLEEAEQAAQAAVEAARESRSAEAVMETVWAFYEVYNAFLTNSNLAYIRYHADLNDIYWQGEEEFCAEKTPQLEMYLEDIYCAIAESDLCGELEEEYFEPGWFDSYREGEFYDEQLLALMEREQDLIGEYYTLTAGGQDQEGAQYYDACTEPMLGVLAQLVRVRRELAQYTGYDSYTDFAWDFYYYRDYTPAQAEEYLETIRTDLVPVYRQMVQLDVFGAAETACSEQAVYEYVKKTAEAMGGEAWEAFRLMEEAELYDIGADACKSGLSFETYLPTYYQPFVFLSGTGTRYDCLAFAHEFGHFATDYAAGGTGAGIDVLEIFSQAMELLSLEYGQADEALADLKLADCLCTYVEQAAYARFELELYAMADEALTAEGILDRYEQICTAYGCDYDGWDPRELITVPHFFSNPMYIISYVVSNDAALQLYQLELAEPGSGRDIYLQSLDTQQAFFLAFLQEAGLQSPFGRIDSVRALMEARFGSIEADS